MTVVCVLSYQPQCYGVGQLRDAFMVVYNEAVLSGVHAAEVDLSITCSDSMWLGPQAKQNHKQLFSTRC